MTRVAPLKLVEVVGMFVFFPLGFQRTSSGQRFVEECGTRPNWGFNCTSSSATGIPTTGEADLTREEFWSIGDRTLGAFFTGQEEER